MNNLDLFIEEVKKNLNSYTYIAKKMKISISVATRCLTENNMYDYLNLPNENIQKEIVSLYNKNISAKNIVKMLKIPLYTVSAILRKNNYIIESYYHTNRQEKIDHHYFDIINDEHKAYWLGFLYADGYNSYSTKKYQIRLDLKKEDKYILEELRKDLKSKYELYYRTALLPVSGTGEYYGLNFYSKNLSTALKNLGCVENKTYVLNFPSNEQVPKELLWHFIRGYFDGDGSIWFTEKNYSQCLSFQGNKTFLKKMQDFIKQETDIELSLDKGNGKVSELRTGGRLLMLKILNTMYKDATIYLKRKYNRHIKIKSFNRLDYSKRIKRGRKKHNNKPS